MSGRYTAERKERLGHCSTNTVAESEFLEPNGLAELLEEAFGRDVEALKASTAAPVPPPHMETLDISSDSSEKLLDGDKQSPSVPLPLSVQPSAVFEQEFMSMFDHLPSELSSEELLLCSRSDDDDDRGGGGGGGDGGDDDDDGDDDDSWGVVSL